MIYGGRIRLRKNEKEDLPRYVEWFNDPEVRHGLSMLLPMSSDDEQDWFEAMRKRPPEEHPLAVDVREGDGWRHVGSTGLFGFDWVDRKAEFGISIGDKSQWSQGYGTEVTRLILKHGFETLNLNRIWLRVFDQNPRARRVYEKAGYVHEGTFRQDQYQEGRYWDVHVMSVLREEWKKE